MRTLNPRELEIGMTTAEPVKTPVGQFLAPAGTQITRQLINRMKLYRVESVVVYGDAPQESSDEVEAIPANPTPESPTTTQPKTHAENAKTHSQRVASSDAFRSFQFNYFDCIDQMKIAFTAAVDSNQTLDTQELLSRVSKLFRSRNTIIELFDMLYNMRTITDSVYAHCLNVALISRMIGRWLKLAVHDLDVLTLAGLFHDIGKLKIPEEILNKPGDLSDEEFSQIRQHPRLGYEILKNQPNLDPRIKKSALMHHERCDGSGYPSGLGEDFIDNYAMIVAIADVYDAMTAARSYRAPLCPFQVISCFEQDGYQKYHTRYILTFLKQIALTYQSNRVILSDGRGCKIIMFNQNSLSRPIVQFDDNTCLDLSTENKDLYIKAVL